MGAELRPATYGSECPSSERKCSLLPPETSTAGMNSSCQRNSSLGQFREVGGTKRSSAWTSVFAPFAW